MAQINSANSSSSAPGPSRSESPLQSLDEQIAETDRNIKELQHTLQKLNEEKSSTSAFEQDQTAKTKAIDDAIGKVELARVEAATATKLEDEVAELLSDAQIKATQDAIDKVTKKTASLREAVATSADDVLAKIESETNAKAATQNAKEATAAARWLQSERARLIEVEIARIKGLVSEAQTARNQGQNTIAYLLILDLKVAVERLNGLAETGSIQTLNDNYEADWKAEVAAASAERDATWALGKAKQWQQTAQTDLESYESKHRQLLDELSTLPDDDAEPNDDTESGRDGSSAVIKQLEVAEATLEAPLAEPYWNQPEQRTDYS